MIPVLQLVKNTKHALPCIPSIIVLVNQFLEIKISIQFVVLAQLQEFALGSFVGSIFSTNELSFVSGDANLAKQGVCKFENLSSSSKISYGSIIATAGISKKMPKGIIIGTVKDINNDDTDISSYAAVEPGTDIEKVTSVLILTSYSESEGK